MLLITLILGFIFGALLQYAKLNRYNTISGLAILKDLTVAKAILAAIGAGAILINIEIGLGLASYHVKPLILGGILLGGIIFGIGMAILGYCPGTLAVSFGEGSLDALAGIIGGLLGGWVFTLILPGIKSILGPNLGAVSLRSVIGAEILFFLLVLIFSILLLWFAFWLHKREGAKDYKWLYAGIGLAILNAIVFLTVVSNRPIGASTTYPYLADLIAGLKNNDYFQIIHKPGHWELIFLSGAFLAGLIISLLRKEFKLTLIHSNWQKYKNDSKGSRLIWALVGGFVLIFGARMAGGCTSGHILSGGMQIAFSSLIFGVFVFLGLVLTGKLFYKNQ